MFNTTLITVSVLRMRIPLVYTVTYVYTENEKGNNLVM